MIDFNRHNEIENYLQGNLTLEQKTAFEAKIAADQNLRDEVELQKLTNSVVIGGAKIDIKNQLKDIHSNFKKEEQNKQKLKWLVAIAALLIALTTVFTLLNKPAKQQEEQKEDSSPVVSQTTPDEQKESPLITVEPTNIKSESDEGTSSINTAQPTNKKRDDQTKNNEFDDEFNDNKSKRDTVNYRDSVKGISRDSGSDDSRVLVDPIPVETDSLSLLNTGTVTGRCSETEMLSPKYTINQPCFGKSKGSIQFDDDRLEVFILDNNTREIYSYMDKVNLSVGHHRFIGVDENSCQTKETYFEIKYEDCQFSIRPDEMQYFEFSCESNELPVVFTLRNARSGFEVFKQQITSPGNFEYKGDDNNGSPLPMGNYVYVLSKPSGEFITKGQVTIVR